MSPERITRLTKAQRERILQRDGFTSGMRHYSEEKGFYQNKACPFDGQPCTSLQVHHIEPVRWGLFNLFKPAEINSPDNTITLFECEHVGHCRAGRISEEYARKR